MQGFSFQSIAIFKTIKFELEALFQKSFKLKLELRTKIFRGYRIMLNVVLYAPRIPQNTGQIARACFAGGARLHLIRPLGFQLTAAALKRAAVGYLSELKSTVHADSDAFWREVPDASRAWLISKFGQIGYDRIEYRADDWLVFGNETEGLPAEWLARAPERTLRIPMPNPEARCLNLATAAGIVLFEALRQLREKG